MAKWGKTDLDQVKKHSSSGSGNFLDFVTVETGTPKKLRLVGDPIVLSCHWVTISAGDGQSFKVPFNCAKWLPDDLDYDEERWCPLCEGGETSSFGDDYLDEHCHYENGEWEPGLSAYTIVIDRAEQKSGKVPFRKLRLPMGVFQKIEAIAQDDEWGNPADAEEGYDITFMKTKGQRGGWDKWNDPIMARKSSPLTEEEQQWTTYTEEFTKNHAYFDGEAIVEEVRQMVDRDRDATAFPGDDTGDDEPKPKSKRETSGRRRGKPQNGKKKSTEKPSETDILQEIAGNISGDDDDDGDE